MTKTVIGIGMVILFAVSLGCTMRYSHTIGGTIESAENFKIVNSSSGVDVGLNLGGAYSNAPNGIAFSDPDGAKDVANYPCEVQFSQVDYRSRWYAYWVRVDFPKVEVITYCVKRKKVAAN